LVVEISIFAKISPDWNQAKTLSKALIFPVFLGERIYGKIKAYLQPYLSYIKAAG